ncbi:MAG: hypothetical protein LBE13_13590, partial [Bacteroidales bacterium]|nr:hypothetical protein [Bacteroidales bacterium]
SNNQKINPGNKEYVLEDLVRYEFYDSIIAPLPNKKISCDDTYTVSENRTLSTFPEKIYVEGPFRVNDFTTIKISAEQLLDSNLYAEEFFKRAQILSKYGIGTMDGYNPVISDIKNRKLQERTKVVSYLDIETGLIIRKELSVINEGSEGDLASAFSISQLSKS